MMRIICAASVLMSVFLSGNALAASFDCAKARTSVEKMICSNPRLSYLDETMSHNYQGMLESVGVDKQTRQNIRNEQTAWIAKRNKCSSARCLETVYLDRLDDTCLYGVPGGVHPICTDAEEAQEKLGSLKSTKAK